MPWCACGVEYEGEDDGLGSGIDVAVSVENA